MARLAWACFGCSPATATAAAIGTHDVAGAAEAMRPYLQAKRDADDALTQSGLDWTIVKPGHLTDAAT
jgi:uncharacterized protein YbjT (DUF2867 family)